MSVGAFVGIMALMFLLELPDKTMVATIVMSTRARPGSIVLGASAGFVVQMGIAVAAGSALTLLPVRPKEFVVAALFLGGAAYLLFVPEKVEEREGEREGERETTGTRLKEVTTAFSVLFLGEFGDLTQIQAANLSAKTHQPVEVFVASSIAMIAVTFLGVFGGRALQRIVPLRLIRLGGGAVFAVLGLYTLVEALR